MDHKRNSIQVMKIHKQNGMQGQVKQLPLPSANWHGFLIACTCAIKLMTLCLSATIAFLATVQASVSIIRFL